MRSDAMDDLRATLRAFCPTSKETVTVPQLAETLGLTTESQKQLLRRRLFILAKRGETEMAGRGVWRFIPGKEPSRRGDSYVRMWRAIRIQPRPWRLVDIALIARVERSTVGRYTRWLETEGLIAKSGQEGNTSLWRTTVKGRDHRQTPWPPVDLPDPYRDERKATAQLCRILLLEDPEKPRTRNKIQEQLAVLTARFCTTNGADTPQTTEA